MARSDFRPDKLKKMGNNSEVNKMVKRAAKEVGISEEELSKLVHQEKDAWFEGDFSYAYLIELAEEIKTKKAGKK